MEKTSSSWLLIGIEISQPFISGSSLLTYLHKSFQICSAFTIDKTEASAKVKTLLKHREKQYFKTIHRGKKYICILKNWSDIQGNLPSLRCNDLFGGNCENGNIITLAHHNPRQLLKMIKHIFSAL